MATPPSFNTVFTSLKSSVEHGQVGVDFAQSLVVDDEQCIDVLRHFFHAVEGLVDFTGTFEAERNRDDADGENFEFLGNLGDDGCCARAGSTTHSGDDEGHARAVAEHFADVVARF